MPGCRLHLRIVFPLLALLLIMVAACGGLRPKVSEEELSALTDEDQALVSLYLDPGGPATQKISFELAAIEIGNPDGWLPLSSKPLRVDNANRGQQQLLTLAAMPPGDYNRLRLTFSQASVDGRALSMETGGQHLELPIAGKATRNAGDHCCLFLDWHIGRTAGGVADFFSSFTTRWQSQPLSTDLVCILCDDLRTIYQARPDTGWVVAAMRLEDRFGEAAYDPSRRRMYLLGIDSRILQVIDIYTNRVEDAIPLPLTIAPRYLALAPDGHRAYISDPLGNRLVQLNLASGFVEQQQTFNYRPERIHYLETAAGDLLAVSVPEDQAIHLLNPKTLATVRTISLNGSPGSNTPSAGFNAAEHPSIWRYRPTGKKYMWPTVTPAG